MEVTFQLFALLYINIVDIWTKYNCQGNRGSAARPLCLKYNVRKQNFTSQKKCSDVKITRLKKMLFSDTKITALVHYKWHIIIRAAMVSWPHQFGRQHKWNNTTRQCLCCVRWLLAWLVPAVQYWGLTVVPPAVSILNEQKNGFFSEQASKIQPKVSEF